MPKKPLKIVDDYKQYQASLRDPSPLDLDLTGGPPVATDAGREDEAEELSQEQKILKLLQVEDPKDYNEAWSKAYDIFEKLVEHAGASEKEKQVWAMMQFRGRTPKMPDPEDPEEDFELLLSKVHDAADQAFQEHNAQMHDAKESTHQDANDVQVDAQPRKAGAVPRRDGPRISR